MDLRSLVLDQLRLVLAALQALPRHELHARPDHQDAAQPLADRLREAGIGGPAGGELDADRQGRLLRDAGRLRADEDVTADVGRERAHDLADGGGEDVDPAHDQHVVRTPDAADPRAGAAARAGTGPHLDLIAGAEAQQRGGAVAQVREHELAAGAVLHLDGGARLRVDQLGMDEPARAEVHPVLRLALAPQRDAYVADAHRLRDARAPARLEPQQLHRAHQALRVAGAHRDVAEPDAVEGRERRAGHEGAGVVAGDDPL